MLPKVHELERVAKAAEAAARSAESKVADLARRADENTLSLGAEILAFKRRSVEAEASLRQRDKEIERLAKLVEDLSSTQFEATAARMGSDEAARCAGLGFMNARAFSWSPQVELIHLEVLETNYYVDLGCNEACLSPCPMLLASP